MLFWCILSVGSQKAEYPLSPCGAYSTGADRNIRISQGWVPGGIFVLTDTAEYPFFMGSFSEGKTIDKKNEYIINERIRDREVRVVGPEGNQLGIMNIRDARAEAEKAGLDLVLVSPNAKPPVCRIQDYGKLRYEQMRKDKEKRKKQKSSELKEIRLSPNIDENDLNTKMNQARKFLEKGNRVKVTLRFRGRELAYVKQRKVILDQIAERLSDVASIEKPAKFEGRSMSMVLAAKK